MAVALTRSPYQRATGLLESIEPRGFRPGLERTRELLEAVDDPQQGLRGVLVAGTNGKGSVCATVDSVARRAGLRSVMLTKPHLRSYCERIVIGGEAVGEERFCDAVETVWAAASAMPEDAMPTAFEMLTVAGILVARSEAPDLVVCEVGLGGRLDSTNVLDLGVSAITNVGLDHCDRLGDTVTAIAHEKAAIIKPGDIAVTAAVPPALDLIRARARQVGARLEEVQPGRGSSDGLDGVRVTGCFGGAPLEVACPLIGDFQADNLAVALAVCDALQQRAFAIDRESVVAGCAEVRWPGRMQWFGTQPAVLLDGAHNPPGVTAMVSAALPLVAGRRVIVILAAMRDKDVRSMVSALRPMPAEAIIVTAPDVPRSTPPQELAGIVGGRAIVEPTSARALDRARQLAGREGVVVIVGSLYLAGEMLSLLER